MARTHFKTRDSLALDRLLWRKNYEVTPQKFQDEVLQVYNTGLDEVERTVLAHWFGLGDAEVWIRPKIAEFLGVTETKVYLTLNNSIRKLDVLLQDRLPITTAEKK